MTDARPTGAPVKLRRALLSVSDKTGLVGLARDLHARGVELLSTGGSAAALREAGLPVRDVADVTGFPEIMDGRVKTLHPAIHGGLLGRRGTDDAVMAEHGIAPIDLLVLNLYPFERVAADPAARLDDLVENIDIGGPAMLRAAAKNFAHVAVATDPAQYAGILAELESSNGALSAQTRFALSVAAFNRVAQYDACISDTLSSLRDDGTRTMFPAQANGSFAKVQDLRYGENPHQTAAFYREPAPAPGTLATYRQHQGKALSYNNLADADTAWACVRQFDAPACVIVKHANPCGVAVSPDAESRYLARRTRPAYANRHQPPHSAASLPSTGRTGCRRPAEAIVRAPVRRGDSSAPSRSAKKPCAIVAAKSKRAGAGHVARRSADRADNRWDLQAHQWRSAGTKPWTLASCNSDDLKVVSQACAHRGKRCNDLIFCLESGEVRQIERHCLQPRTEQHHRCGRWPDESCLLGHVSLAIKAADTKSLTGCGFSVMASDAFFPFRDGIDAAAAAGITAVIQPGGSMRDSEVIAAADEAGMAMVFTGVRHFRH